MESRFFIAKSQAVDEGVDGNLFGVKNHK